MTVGGEPLAQAAAITHERGHAIAAKVATRVSGAEETAARKDAVDHGVDVEGVGVPWPRRQGVHRVVQDLVVDQDDLEAAAHAGLYLADPGEQPRPAGQAEKGVHGALVPELGVDDLAVGGGSVAVARQAIAPRQQDGGE